MFLCAAACWSGWRWAAVSGGEHAKCCELQRGRRVGPHVRRRLPQHRAQPDVPPAGRRERVVREARHREPRQEAEGETRRARQSDHGDHDERRAPVKVRHHTAHPRRTTTGDTQTRWTGVVTVCVTDDYKINGCPFIQGFMPDRWSVPIRELTFCMASRSIGFSRACVIAFWTFLVTI